MDVWIATLQICYLTQYSTIFNTTILILGLTDIPISSVPRKMSYFLQHVIFHYFIFCSFWLVLHCSCISDGSFLTRGPRLRGRVVSYPTVVQSRRIYVMDLKFLKEHAQMHANSLEGLYDLKTYQKQLICYLSLRSHVAYSRVQSSPAAQAPAHLATSPRPQTALKKLVLVPSRTVRVRPVPPPAVFDFRRWPWRVWLPRWPEVRRWMIHRRRSARDRRHAALRTLQWQQTYTLPHWLTRATLQQYANAIVQGVRKKTCDHVFNDTLCLKKNCTLFGFCNKLVERQPVSIIFGTVTPE